MDYVHPIQCAQPFQVIKLYNLNENILLERNLVASKVALAVHSHSPVYTTGQQGGPVPKEEEHPLHLHEHLVTFSNPDVNLWCF